MQLRTIFYACLLWDRQLNATRQVLEVTQTLAKIGIWTEIQTSILQTFDIPQGILIGLGYNVSIADEGARYSEKERRHACHSQIKDFITTLTETQGGTGGNLHNFDRWDVPLFRSMMEECLMN